MIRRLKNVSIDSVGANSLWIILQMQCNCKSMYQSGQYGETGRRGSDGNNYEFQSMNVWEPRKFRKRKGHEGGLTLPDIKRYFKAVVIKE